MNRRVVSARIPYLPIAVKVPERHFTAEFTALVATGFTALVVVPQAAIATGGLALLHSDVRLADDSRVTVPSYLGSIRIGDTTITR
ncbi:MAG: hypothetical protein ACR2PL_25425 [Dehalococcoidia bacterium]